MTYERAKRASAEFQYHIHLQEYDTIDRQIVQEWGIQDGLYIDGNEVNMGPPPSYAKIRRKLREELGQKFKMV